MVPVVDRQPGCVRGQWVPKHLNVGEEGSCGLGGAKVCVKNTSITVVEKKDGDRADTQNKFGKNVMTSITKEKAQNHEPRKQMGPIVRHGARQVVSAPVRAKTLRKRYLLTAVASFLVFGVGAGGAEKDLTNKLCAVACNFTGAWYEARTPSDDPVAAEDLLRRGADRDARVCDWSGRENWTFLSCAAYLNNFGVAKTIVAHRPSIVNSTNEEGTTPLMFAVEYHFDEFGKMLVEHGAPINAKKSKDGDTAIRMAIKADLAKTVEMSLDHGLSVNARRRIAPEALRAVFQQWDNAQILNSHTSLSDREMRDFCI